MSSSVNVACRSGAVGAYQRKVFNRLMQTTQLQAALENTRRTIALSRRLRSETEVLSVAQTKAAVAFANMVESEKTHIAECLLASRELLRDR